MNLKKALRKKKKQVRELEGYRDKLIEQYTDPHTFFHSFQYRYNRLPNICVADSGYGSEENYRFMQENGIEAFIKNSVPVILPTRSMPKVSITMPKRIITFVLWDST